MSLELAIAIGGYLAESGTVKLADRILTGVNTKLNTQELDKALKAGVDAAHKQEGSPGVMLIRFINKSQKITLF